MKGALTGESVAVDAQLMQIAALLDSDPQAAADGAARILAEHPGHVVATLLLGTARRSLGDPSAESAFRDLASTQPDSALIQLELGQTLRKEGKQAEALAALQRAVDLEPNLAEAWREISFIHNARGDIAACDTAYDTYTRLADPEKRVGEAAAAYALSRLDEAERLARRQLEKDREDVGALRVLAAVAADREDFVTAERLLGRCLELAPGYRAARFDLARTYFGQQKAEPMVPLIERLLVTCPDDALVRSLLASAKSLLGYNDEALAILTQLVAENPDNERVQLALGHALRFAGRFADAVAAYRHSAALRPEFGEAYFSLSNLKTFRFTQEDIDTMLVQVARGNLAQEDRLQFEFALGKALEDAADYERSFEHYSRGNALRRAQAIYSSDANTQLANRTMTLFTREFLDARRGFGSPAPDPIFIVGMPRAGSTLIEQILASHSQVAGTRELPDIPGFALELGVLSQHGQPPEYPQSLARLSRRELTALGERYLQQTRAHRLRGTPYFIDKMPSNFFHAGLIRLILPNARIIDARRSPLGCCFSNFKQHFQSGVWFSYDLEDIGRYYRDYVRLMAHFDAVMPGHVHRVYYENVVADLEGEVRKLLDYCGLPFEEQCLRFHETRRVVQTASSEQVRRPLFADGVDQWRNFEPWLGKLKAVLGELIDEYPGGK